MRKYQTGRIAYSSIEEYDLESTHERLLRAQERHSLPVLKWLQVALRGGMASRHPHAALFSMAVHNTKHHHVRDQEQPASSSRSVCKS